jgi:hypothetical protein
MLLDGLHEQNMTAILGTAEVDVEKILGIVESFVSFPLSAETIYFKTKRRLRNEIVNDGLLSPRSIATEVANHIKFIGHDILDVSVAAIGASILLPYAKRILRMCYASILTSSSGPVRQVMDPTSVVQLGGKKRRWLHLSVSMRARSIETLERVVAGFRSDVTQNGASFSNSKQAGKSATLSTDGERAIGLVVGCLLEQISSKKTQIQDFDDDWGTTTERANLVVASCRCLGAYLISCGGFVPGTTRSLIESVVSHALVSYVAAAQTAPPEILLYAPIKTAIIQLGCACLSSPWEDGSSSSIIDLLTSVANNLDNDANDGVAISAKSLSSLCRIVCVPRAPALHYTPRAVADSSQSNDAISLAKDIESTRNEARQARQRIDLAKLREKSIVEEKRRREIENEQEKVNKRQKSILHDNQVKQLDKVLVPEHKSFSDTRTNAAQSEVEVAEMKLEDAASFRQKLGVEVFDDKTAPKSEVSFHNGEREREQWLDDAETEVAKDNNSNGLNSDDETEMPDIFGGGPDDSDAE